jgi:tricarballylate dehydrogenase
MARDVRDGPAPTTGGYDVVVIGGGNAGLCAALAARAQGASVVVLESAPRHCRGGNSRHVRNLRCAHAAPTELNTDRYGRDELLADLKAVNDGETDAELAALVAARSEDCVTWLGAHGVRFQTALRGTLQLERTNAFFLGGGTALMNSLYAAAERRGIEVRYDAEVVGLELRDGAFLAATVRGTDSPVRGDAVVLAAGGFEGNREWLCEAWGDAARNFVIRGTPYNRGTLLRLALDAGAGHIGDERECHAVAVDGRAPRFDGGIVTRLDCVPLGIVVDRTGARFYDEGEDVWPKRYAIWGKLVARRPGEIAYAIVDAKVHARFMPSAFPPIEAQSLRELAARLELPADTLETTVTEFNRAVQPGTFDAARLDDCRTTGLAPDKTHWAQRLDTPPYWGYPLRPGITFTYLGLRVDADARVLAANGLPFANVYAAGEIMAGNVLRKGYIAGIGMTIGTVFGRIAGQNAARHARH